MVFCWDELGWCQGETSNLQRIESPSSSILPFQRFFREQTMMDDDDIGRMT
jgi:hypothetical protein